MRIGITGASGHIGNVLCRMLLEKKSNVRALYNQNKEPLADLEGTPLFETAQGDLLKPESLGSFAGGCDIIINCAALISIHGDPDGKVFRTNTEGVKNLIEACQKAGVKKIIHLSSTHAVIEEPLDKPFDETRPYKPKGSFPYDYSKATGEQIFLGSVKKGEIDGFVLRPSSVIGPFDFRPSEMGKALLDFYRGRIPVLPEGGYDFVDVRDVCQSIISSIEKGKHGEIYLLSGKYYDLKQLSGLIKKITGKKIPRIVLPYWFLKAVLPLVKLYGALAGSAPVFTLDAITALKKGHPYMDHSKAEKFLGHRCRPLEETIRDFYDWNKKRNIIS